MNVNSYLPETGEYFKNGSRYYVGKNCGNDYSLMFLMQALINFKENETTLEECIAQIQANYNLENK